MSLNLWVLQFERRYDVVLGFVFAQSDALVPIDFWMVGGAGRINTRRTAEIMNRRNNYSVYDICAQNCEVRGDRARGQYVSLWRDFRLFLFNVDTLTLESQIGHSVHHIRTLF